jgi:hypothetical protein
LLTVTGHSLGGALAPSYALFLSDTRGIWDPETRTQIACLASAGPTPGNSDFAVYFRSQLEPTTTRFWNTLDVVPHVWNARDIDAIPNLYAPDISPDPLVPQLVDAAREFFPLGGYTHITPADGRPGVVNRSPDVFNPAAGDFSNYLRQMIYQHVEAYAELFEVPKVGKLMSDFAPSPDASSLLRVAALRLALQRRLLATALRPF